MDNINVSIIMCVYNQEKLVIKSLDSIPKRKDLELIIIDDCSTDKSADKISRGIFDYESDFGNIIYKTTEKHQGSGYCKYLGFGLVNGKYCISINPDDYVYTKEYNRCIDYVIASDKDIVYINNDINDGTIWQTEIRKDTWHYFAKVSFFMNSDIKYSPEVTKNGDEYLFERMKEIPHEEEHLDIVAYHYNYPHN